MLCGSLIFKNNIEAIVKKLLTKGMSSFTPVCDMDSHGLKHFNDPTYTGTQIFYDPVSFTEKYVPAF